MPTGNHTNSNTETWSNRGSRSVRVRRLVPLCIILIISASLPLGCQQHNRIEEQKSRTLTPDERYLIELYMKITEFEENLQDNPEAAEEKREELRAEIDLERIGRILDELERDPERWLAIYNRIDELKRRRQPDSPN